MAERKLRKIQVDRIKEMIEAFDQYVDQHPKVDHVVCSLQNIK